MHTHCVTFQLIAKCRKLIFFYISFVFSEKEKWRGHTFTDQAQTQHVRGWNNVLQPSCSILIGCLVGIQHHGSTVHCVFTQSWHQMVGIIFCFAVESKTTRHTAENCGTHNVAFYFGEMCLVWDAEVLFSKRWAGFFIYKQENPCREDTLHLNI